MSVFDCGCFMDVGCTCENLDHVMVPKDNRPPREPFDIAKSYANAIKKSYEFKVIEENRMAWASGFSHGEEETMRTLQAELDEVKCKLIASKVLVDLKNDEISEFKSKLERAESLLREILNQGHLAAQGGWDATNKMKSLAFKYFTGVNHD